MIRYLNAGDVAERIGVKRATLSRYRLPEPDALLGVGPSARPGWLPATIDTWNGQRPGRGWWGPTPPGKRRGGRTPTRRVLPHHRSADESVELLASFELTNETKVPGL